MKTNQVTYRNTTISYSDNGKGHVVVLLHGFLENATMWESYLNDFSEKHRVITIDLLGHGKTECIGYIHTMEDMANAVHAVLSELKIQKVTIVGHSMGGYVALAYSELYPENVKGLVLLNSTALEDNLDRKANRVRAIKAVKQNYTTFINMSIANLFSAENRNKLTVEIENVKKEALKTPLQGIIAALEGMKIRKNRQFILTCNRFPILFILGKKDPVLQYDDTVHQIENTAVQLITFPDGHMSHIENKDVLGTILLDFFESNTV